MNLLLTVGTGITLLSIMKKQPNIGNTLTGKTVISLLVRVSVAVGLEWISGLLCYFIPSSTINQYAFIILVSLHGLWVLISTLTLESVREKWIKGFLKKNTENRVSQVSDMTDLTSTQSAKRVAADVKKKTGEIEDKQHGKSNGAGKTEQTEVSTENHEEIQTKNKIAKEPATVKSKLRIWKQLKDRNTKSAPSALEAGIAKCQADGSAQKSGKEAKTMVKKNEAEDGPSVENQNQDEAISQKQGHSANRRQELTRELSGNVAPPTT